MRRLGRFVRRVLLADPIVIEMGLLTTTFWMFVIVSLPYNTSLQYKIDPVDDHSLGIVLLFLLLLQIVSYSKSSRNRLATVASFATFFFYTFSALLSFSNYPGGLGSMMFVPALGSVYLILKSGVMREPNTARYPR